LRSSRLNQTPVAPRSTAVDPIRIFGKGHVVRYGHLAAALLCGILLRWFFISHFNPFAGDAKFYEELARNWLYHGVYGRTLHGQLLPSDERMPGYPAFLAAIYRTLGQSRAAVTSVQVVVDLMTCVLTSVIAAQLAPVGKRRLAATIALWLAALGPFTASYTGVVLTETLATFFTALAVLIFVRALTDPTMNIARAAISNNRVLKYAGWFFLGGIIVGLGTLVRPETPLILIALGLVLCARWWSPTNWWKLALAILWVGAGLILPLSPWAARNVLDVGQLQFLAPPHAETPGDRVLPGFYDWTQTWLVKFRDAYSVSWKLGEKSPIDINSIPDYAFDSDAERAQVSELINEYNKRALITPTLNLQFEQLANERAARHPVRTYVAIPLERAWWTWFTPRIELLPYSGNLWPMREAWHNNAAEFSATLGLGILNYIYVGMALVGAWKFRARAGISLLLAFLLIRTAFLTQLQTVEPRYVMECFPVVLALCALAWTKPRVAVDSPM
jgi:4-amino-4-deoxy-L-arabinose transferase-like glycosyltransferase